MMTRKPTRVASARKRVKNVRNSQCTENLQLWWSPTTQPSKNCEFINYDRGISLYSDDVALLLHGGEGLPVQTELCNFLIRVHFLTLNLSELAARVLRCCTNNIFFPFIFIHQKIYFFLTLLYIYDARLMKFQWAERFVFVKRFDLSRFKFNTISDPSLMHI